MAKTERQQLVVEQMLEDERLRGDLEDTAARALLNWATRLAGGIAADAARSDEQVDAEVQAVRRAAVLAASSGESDPERVVARAAAALPAPAQAATLSDSAAPTETVSARAMPAETLKPAPVSPAPATPAPVTQPDRLERALVRRRTRFGKLLKRLRGGA